MHDSSVPALELLENNGSMATAYRQFLSQSLIATLIEVFYKFTSFVMKSIPPEYP